MELKEYLKEHDISVTEFAALSGICYSTIYAYMSKLRRPSKVMAHRIEQVTKSKVKAIELRKIVPIKKEVLCET